MIKEEYKAYVQLKKDSTVPPKTSIDGLGYFEDNKGWYIKQGELIMEDPKTITHD